MNRDGAEAIAIALIVGRIRKVLGEDPGGVAGPAGAKAPVGRGEADGCSGRATYGLCCWP